MKQSIHNIGYTFIAAWVYILFNGVLLVPAIDPTALVSSTHIISSLSTGFTGFALAVLSIKLVSLERHREIVYLAGVVGASGTSCIALSGSGFLASEWMMAGYLLVGIGMAGLKSAWQERLILQGRRQTVYSLSVFTCLGACLCLLINLLPFEIALPLAAVLPIAAAFFLLFKPLGGEEKTPEKATEADLPGCRLSLGESFLHAPMRLFAVVAIVSFAYGSVRTLGILDGVLVHMGNDFIMSVGCPMVATVAATLVVFFARKFDTAIVFYLALPIMAAVSLIPLAGDPLLGTIAHGIVSFGTELIMTLAIFLIMDCVKAKRIYALFGVGVLWFSHMIGTALGQIVAESVYDQTTMTIVILVLLLFAALIVLGGAPRFSVASFSPAGDKEKTKTVDGPMRDDRLCRIDSLAERHGLSNRESEILELWGTGHTSGFIEQQLFISKNTVKTHLTHIYAKIGVSSKEDLLQMIENEDPRNR